MKGNFDMANANATDRAASLIRNSMFLTLATTDRNTPWSIPLAFSVGRNSSLIFYSAVESLHSQQIEVCSDVSASIFVVEPSVDGIQMSGVCSVVQDDEVGEVSSHYFKSLFSGNDLAWWERPASNFVSGALWRFYRVEITAAFVIEQDRFADTRLDRRLTVNLDELKAQIALD